MPLIAKSSVFITCFLKCERESTGLFNILVGIEEISGVKSKSCSSSKEISWVRFVMAALLNEETSARGTTVRVAFSEM